MTETPTGPDTGFKLFRLIKDVLAESRETDTDQLALEVLDRIPWYERETALYQALRQMVRTSFRPAFIPPQPRGHDNTQPQRPQPGDARDGRQWLTPEGAERDTPRSWAEVRADRPPDEAEVAAHRERMEWEARRDAALAQDPEFIAGREAADAQIANGDLGQPLNDVIDELDAEDDTPGPTLADLAQQPKPYRHTPPRRQTPPPARPKPSPKVAAIREAWRKSLMQRIAVGEGKHKFLGDCTVPDLEFAAKQREEHAKRTADRAGELRRLMDLMRKHDATKLSDLPAEVLADAPLDGAA